MAELWNLYDEKRNPLGRTHVRGEKFNEGEFYECCEIWVVNSEGKFLTTKRHPNKKAGNQWEFVGGGTLSHETTVQSAVRELKEETGISTSAEELRFLATYSYKNYFDDIFLLQKDVALTDIVLQPGETIDAKWADDAEIKRMIESGEFVHSVGVRYGLFRELV